MRNYVITVSAIVSLTLPVFMGDARATDSTIPVYSEQDPNLIVDFPNATTNVAIFQDSNPWGSTKIQTILAANGISYAIYGTSSIGNINLAAYDKVIISSVQSSAFYSALENNRAWFEAYVSSGGILDIHSATQSGERTQVLLPGGFVYTFMTWDNVQISDVTHPIVTTPHVISDAELDNWNSSVHGYFSTVPVGAHTILILSSGQPCAAELNFGKGRIFVTSQTVEWDLASYNYLENTILYSAKANNDNLVITPGGGLASSGFEGGPFSPSSISYTLSSADPNSVQWTAASTQNWVDVAPAGGVIAGGGSATANVSLTSYAYLLPLGSYSADVNFTNVTSGKSQIRRVSLSVLPQQTKLTASDGYSNDYFGYSVAISGDKAIIGARADDDLGADCGSAYIFEQTAGGAWVQQAKLIASDGYSGDYFGNSVAISGDKAIVGACYDDDKGANSGSAYIFERTGGGAWVQQAKLTASDGYSGDYFGFSVAISGDKAIVGAFYDDDKGTDSGSAYIFERIGGSWTQVAKLTASDGYSSDYFGFSVAISGDYVIVGAYGDDDKGSSSGSAYIFERIAGGAWVQQAKLTASDGYNGDNFGCSVAISGDKAVVGAFYDDDKGTDSGSAYVFERTGGGAWIQQAKLTASDGYSGDYFGFSVGISGDRAIVGAFYDDDKGTDSGSAYIFARTMGGTWVQQHKQTASDGYSADYFGYSVGIDGTLSIVGAHRDDDKGTDSGSAYIFGTRDDLILRAVAAPEEFNAIGYESGPFEPNDKSYILTNIGQTQLEWSLQTTAAWLSADYYTSTLPAGANTVVTVSVNSYANTLAPGTYQDGITFSNLNTGYATNRLAQLTVLNIPGEISVEPNAVAFGEVVVGVSATKTITIRNTSPDYDLLLTDISFRNSFEGFSDEFNEPVINPSNWTVAGGEPTVDDVGISEPSPPYSLRMNGYPSGGDTVVSRAINLTGFTNIQLSYWYERTGGGEHSDPGEDLIFSYWNGSTWVELERQLGGGTDMTTYEHRTLTLPAEAYREDFKLRISNIGTPGYYDDWFVDDVSLNLIDGTTLVDIDALGWLRLENIPHLPASIPPLGSIDVNLVCEPKAVKDYEATLVIKSDDADESEINLEVTGSGIPEFLRIAPSEEIVFSGHPGGPFVPSSSTYNLTNNGPMDIVWSVSEPNWIDISPSSGTLTPGESVLVIVSPNAAAEAMSKGSHAGDILFIDETTTMRISRIVKLIVSTNPKIWVEPKSIDVIIPQTQSRTGLLTIGNTGGDSDLVFSLSGHWSPPSGGISVDTVQASVGLTVTKQDYKKLDFSTLKADALFKPGELLVRFAPPQGNRHGQLTASEKQTVLNRLGGGVIKRSFKLLPDLCLVELPHGRVMSEALSSFNEDAAVLYAQPNYEIHALATMPNDPSFGTLWGMHNIGQSGGKVDADIDAPEAWDTATGNHNVIVAVIDTGIDYTHEDLAANMWVNTAEKTGIAGVDDDGNGYVDDIYGYDFCNKDGDPMDDHYHGTHCAGTIGAVGNNGVGVTGVCWNVRLMAVKFLNSSGSGNDADAIASIEYAAAMGADVMSNSWGGTTYSQALKDAIDAVGRKGILFVAAAGNDGVNNDINPHYPSSYDCANIIAVMATDRTDIRSSFSCYGPVSVDLGAPGTAILSCQPGNGYQLLDGTSMATPHVSGACALLRSANPSLDAQQIKNILLQNVDPTLSGQCVSGGRLNLNNALTALPASAPMVQFIPQGGIVPAGQTLNVQIIYDGNRVGGLYEGQITVTSNDEEFPQISIPTNIEIEPLDQYTEMFDNTDNDLNGLSFIFSPLDHGRYTVCTESVNAFPLESSDGTTLVLGDDDYAAIHLDNNVIPFFGTSYEGFYVGSNGYVSFLSGDTEHIESLVRHFSLPRIAALFDDLDPSAGGRVSWKKLNDRVVVTYEDVPEYGSSNTNSFQIEMFYSGRIRLTLLKISALDGLVGLSDGRGLSGYFTESNLSGYGSCVFDADFNRDMAVNMEDFAIFASHWLEESRPVVSTVRDNFDAISYSGNNGSTAWNDSWTEAGENDGPTVGLIQVLPKKNLFLGADQVYSPYVCSLTRSVNLGGATWATLSYDYSMEKGSNSGYIYVQLSNDGGVTWTTLSTLTSGSGSGSTSLDIAAYVSANTKIRFELHPERRLRLKAHIDNVQVEFDDRTQQCVPWADNCDINRDFKVDTADLVEFASRWLIGI